MSIVEHHALVGNNETLTTIQNVETISMNMGSDNHFLFYLLVTSTLDMDISNSFQLTFTGIRMFESFFYLVQLLVEAFFYLLKSP